MDQIQKSIPLHLQAYEILKKQILTGKLISGERLLEKKLSQDLGVSRSPIREALRMLEQDELVVLNPNGLIVNSLEMSDMKEIYQCSIAIEPYAVNLAASNLNEKDIKDLRAFIQKARESHLRKEYNVIVEFNTGFHESIIVKCGNSRLISIIDKLRALTILRRRAELEFYHKRSDEYLLEHEEILDALAQKDGETAELLMKKHIMNDYKVFEKMYKK
jgi:DNA-binding GntR family transcriptional regulator